MINKKLYNAWYSQKWHAQKRGLGFSLSFDEWLEIWIKSGRLSERGCGKTKYVMARHRDEGPYAVGNVKIISNLENVAEQWEFGGKRIRALMSKAATGKPKPWLKGRRPSDESIAKKVETRKATGYVPLLKSRLLTVAQILMIRKTVGEKSIYVLAKECGVAYTTVKQVLDGRTYRDV